MAPSFISTISAQKATELNNNRYREAFVGRVAMGAYLGMRSEQLGIGPLLAIDVFQPEDLAFRLEQWLAYGVITQRDSQKPWIATRIEQPLLTLAH